MNFRIHSEIFRLNLNEAISGYLSRELNIPFVLENLFTKIFQRFI